MRKNYLLLNCLFLFHINITFASYQSQIDSLFSLLQTEQSGIKQLEDLTSIAEFYKFNHTKEFSKTLEKVEAKKVSLSSIINLSKSYSSIKEKKLAPADSILDTTKMYMSRFSTFNKVRCFLFT